MTDEPALPWRPHGVAMDREAVLRAWSHQRVPPRSGQSALRSALPSMLKLLASWPWVVEEYGHDVAAMARTRRGAAVADAAVLDGLWRLLDDHAGPLALWSARTATQLQGQVRTAGMSAGSRRKLEEKMRGTLGSVVCTAAAHHLGSAEQVAALVVAQAPPPDVVAAVVRRAIDVAEAFATTLGTHEAEDRSRILGAIGLLEREHGRNPAPPVPTAGGHAAVWEAIAPDVLKYGEKRWVRGFEGRVLVEDVLAQATDSLVTDLVRLHARGRQITDGRGLPLYLHRRAIDLLRKRATERKAIKMRARAEESSPPVANAEGHDQGQGLASVLRQLADDPSQEAALARRFVAEDALRDDDTLPDGDALRRHVADALPAHRPGDLAAVVARVQQLLVEALHRAEAEDRG